MKRKLIKQLIAIVVTGSICVVSPVMTFAEEETVESIPKNESAIYVDLSNPTPIIWDENDIKVSVKNVHFDYNSGNSFYQIEFDVENNSTEEVNINGNSACIDDYQIPYYTSSSTVIAGKKGICNASIWTKDFEKVGVSDFEKWEFDITLYKGDTKISNKILSIDKILLDQEENKVGISLDKTDFKESNLNDESAELKEKISVLESENQDLKDENEKLKKQNKKLKKQVKELEETTSSSDTEETTVDTVAVEEVQIEESQPVTEYKDSTTIRIVQQILNERGYNCGTPDGISGGKTSEAIRSYQADKGMTVNGLVTDELIQALDIVEKVQEAVKAEGSKNEYDSSYTYDQLARNPDTYMDKKVKISGKVLQANTSDTICYARIAMNSNYDTVIFVTYDASLLGYRLLEDDYVTVYGIFIFYLPVL